MREHQHTRKKSIDLEFMVWQRLAGLVRDAGVLLIRNDSAIG